MNESSPNKWQFLMSKRHKRRGQLWQFFFTGWGLFFTIALVSSPFVFKNMTWAVLDIVDMASLEQNNLSITDMKLNGVDKNGEPFTIHTATALQKFDEPDIIYFTKPVATMVRVKNGAKIIDTIVSKKGKFLNNLQKIVLNQDVKINSSDGTSARTNEMEIDLKEW